jgi:hypothetical protein
MWKGDCDISQILSQHLLVVIEEKCEKCHSGLSTSQSRFKQGTYRVKNWGVTAWTILLGDLRQWNIMNLHSSFLWNVCYKFFANTSKSVFLLPVCFWPLTDIHRRNNAFAIDALPSTFLRPLWVIRVPSKFLAMNVGVYFGATRWQQCLNLYKWN